MKAQRDQRARRRKPLPNSHEEYLQRVQESKDDSKVGGEVAEDKAEI